LLWSIAKVRLELIIGLVGDLAYHIKRKLTKNETFSEVEVFNWFV